MLGGEVHTKQQQTEERKKTEQNNPESARGWTGWREEWGKGFRRRRRRSSIKG